VSFAAITLCVASQRVLIVASVYFVVTQSGNFWIHLHKLKVRITSVVKSSYPVDKTCKPYSHVT
jgi:hypothetical protein